MATKKPSLTKQIAEVLGTEDKREQLKRIETLLQKDASPTVAVTVLFSENQTQTTVVGPNVSADNVKYILSTAIEEVTEMVVRAKIAQEEEALSKKGGEELPGPQTGDTMENGDMTP